MPVPLPLLQVQANNHTLPVASPSPVALPRVRPCLYLWVDTAQLLVASMVGIAEMSILIAASVAKKYPRVQGGETRRK